MDVCLVQDSLDRLAPEGRHYRHDDEGSDDMPAHVRPLPLHTDAALVHVGLPSYRMHGFSWLIADLQ